MAEQEKKVQAQASVDDLPEPPKADNDDAQVKGGGIKRGEAAPAASATIRER